MRAIKYRELKRMYDANGPEKTVRHLQEALQAGDLKADDFSIRELAEVSLGAERVQQMDPRYGGSALLEAGDGVDVTAFSNITGQVVQAKILEAYNQEAFIVSKLVDRALDAPCVLEFRFWTAQANNAVGAMPRSKAVPLCHHLARVIAVSLHTDRRRREQLLASLAEAAIPLAV